MTSALLLPHNPTVSMRISSRGGCEDTTFEVKDSEKCQGQSCEDCWLPRSQGQKGSRPRTRGHVWKYAQI